MGTETTQRRPGVPKGQGWAIGSHAAGKKGGRSWTKPYGDAFRRAVLVDTAAVREAAWRRLASEWACVQRKV